MTYLLLLAEMDEPEVPEVQEEEAEAEEEEEEEEASIENFVFCKFTNVASVFCPPNNFILSSSCFAPWHPCNNIKGIVLLSNFFPIGKPQK